MRDELEQIRDLEAENEKLKSQVARIAEALRSFDPSDESENYSYSFGLRKKALSPYDPKWIEGVRAEAEVQGGREGLLIGFREAVDYFWNKLPNDHSVWESIASRDAVLMRLVNDTKSYSPEEDKSRQQNQSREERG